MSETAVEGASRPSRRLQLSAVAAWGLLTIILPLAALTLNFVTFAGFPLGFWITAQGALAGLAAIALIFAARAGGTSSGDGWRPPLAFAGEALGAASVIGFTGAIAALGYDGLALPLGLTAGLALMAIAIAPRFALYPVRSIGGFLVTRFGGVWPRRIAQIIAGIASVLLLAANLRAGALALQGAFGADYAAAAAIATVAVALGWITRSLLGPRTALGLVYAALLVCLATAVTALALRHGSPPQSYFAYGDAMGDLAALDQKLVVDKLSDVRWLRPMSSPFLQMSMASFLGIVMALALGVAALPHLLGRHASQGAVAPGDASRRAAIATAWVALLAIGFASFAVFARLGVAGLIARGLETAVVPQELVDARALNLVEICGAAIDADIAAACAKVSGQRGFLRMQDLVFSSDAFVIAAPSMSGLPANAILPFWAAVMVAAVAAGAAILKGYLEADGEARSRGGVEPNALDFRSVVIAIALLLAAALVAVAGRMEIPELFSEGLALIAAGLFPALLLGLYWRRLTATGAIAAMLTGFAVAAIYIAGVRLFPALMFEWTGGLSNAAPGAIRKFETLQATVAATDEARAAAATALHRHAATIANWGGLRPAAIVLFAVPLGFLAGVAATRRGKPAKIEM